MRKRGMRERESQFGLREREREREELIEKE